FRFLIPSLFGVIIFLFPIKEGASFNIPLGVITEYLIEVLEGYLPFIITYIMIFSTVFSIINYFFKLTFITKSILMTSLFYVSLLFFIFIYHIFIFSDIDYDITINVMINDR